MYSGQSLGFRILTNQGRTKISYITGIGVEQSVVSSFSPQFPEFELSISPSSLTPDFSNEIHVAVIRGVPQLVGHALDGLARSMMQSLGISLYQIWVQPKKPGYLSRKLSEKRYKSILEMSQSQESIEGWLRQKKTRAQYDVGAL